MHGIDGTTAKNRVAKYHLVGTVTFSRYIYCLLEHSASVVNGFHAQDTSEVSLFVWRLIARLEF